MALSTCWSMTINNPTEEMMVLVRNPNHDYIRQLIWTQEVGAEDTPHIQAYLKLIKQQRMSFVKKLYPSAHFQAITSIEYNRNAVDYAQKEDETTSSAHVNTMSEVIADPVYLLNKLLRDYIDDFMQTPVEPLDRYHVKMAMETRPVSWLTAAQRPLTLHKKLAYYLDQAERELIRFRPAICKLLVSAQYNKIKELYLINILEYNIDKYINAYEHERKGTGETPDDQSESSTSSDQEEEIIEEDDEGSTHEGPDYGSEQDCEQESGDETFY